MSPLTGALTQALPSLSTLSPQGRTQLWVHTPFCAVFQLLKLWGRQITPVVSMGMGQGGVILSCKIAQVTSLDRTAESCLLRDL